MNSRTRVHLSAPSRTFRNGHFGLTGVSLSVTRINDLAKLYSTQTETLLITGETGTGKEVLATSIHNHGSRKGKPLVVVNCGGLSGVELSRSELFGHTRGAYTGAISDGEGAFERAHEGTLILDEIGELDPKIQAALLRVLETGEIDTVGKTRDQAVDVRVICLTHRDLRQMILTGAFREDLYYRLQRLSIPISPLRERRMDVPLIVNEVLDALNAQKGTHVSLSTGIVELLSDTGLPGNVRFIENALIPAHIFAAANGSLITTEHVESVLSGLHVDVETQAAVDAFAALERGGQVDFNTRVKDFEEQLIRAALQITGGNVNQAAKLLNLNRTTLVEKMKGKGIKKEEFYK